MDTIKTSNKVFSIAYHTQIKSESYNMQSAREEMQQASFVGSLENTFNYIKTNLGPLFLKVNFMHNKGMYPFTEASIYDKISEQLSFNAMLPVRLYVIADNTTIITITIEPHVYSIEESKELQETTSAIDTTTEVESKLKSKHERKENEKVAEKVTASNSKKNK